MRPIDLFLLLFGWRRVGESYVNDGAEYIRLYLTSHGIGGPLDSKRVSMSKALSQLAFNRAIRREGEKTVIWRDYVHQLEKVAELTCLAMSGREMEDARIRDILIWHE